MNVIVNVNVNVIMNMFHLHSFRTFIDVFCCHFMRPSNGSTELFFVAME